MLSEIGSPMPVARLIKNIEEFEAPALTIPKHHKNKDEIGNAYKNKIERLKQHEQNRSTII